jgi:hypothetical protein
MLASNDRIADAYASHACNAFEEFLVPIVSSEKILLDVLGGNTTPQGSYFVACERGLALDQIHRSLYEWYELRRLSRVCLLVHRFRRQVVGTHVELCWPW